jgi:hypothetical protein
MSKPRAVKYRGKVRGPKWTRDAIELAVSFAPTIYPCAHCGAPVANGYCCGHCGSTTPKGAGDE